MRIGGAALAAAALAWASAAGAQAPTVAQVYSQLAKVKADAAACGWFNPREAAALEAALAERAAGLQAAGQPLPEAPSGEAACAGAAADQAKAQAKQAAAQLSALMVMRADAALSVTDPWTQDITAVGEHRAAVAAMAAQMRAGDAQGAAQMIAPLRTEVSNTFLLICEERKTVRVKNPRICPIVPEANRKFVPVARAWLAGVETVVPLMVQEMAGAGSSAAGAASSGASAEAGFKAPDNPGDYWRYASLGDVEFGRSCEPGELVAYLPEAQIAAAAGANGAEVNTALYRFGGEKVGAITVMSMADTWLPRTMDDTVKAAGVEAVGSFRKCGY